MQKKMNIRTLHMALKTNTASDKPNFTIMIQNELVFIFQSQQTWEFH